MTSTVFSHVGLTCKDPIKVEKFYTKYFGFERARVYLPGPDQVVVIKKGSMSLEIFPTKDDLPIDKPVKDGYPFPGYRHIAFLVDDLDAMIEEMGDDAKVTLGPLDMGDFIKGMRVAWLADPEGNILELNQGYVDEENPPKLD